MSLLHTEYNFILTFLCVAIALAGLLFVLSYALAVHPGDPEKLSAYECGFDPFDDARHSFDVRFYLVAILFIIFDLEVTFLFPWSTVLATLMWVGFVAMIIFLVLLTIGFVYEWQKGGLDWE